MDAASSSSVYTDSFFEQIDHGSLASARVIVPRILSVFNPLSVVDVGCGLGNFLAVFGELGVKDYLGLDGDHVDRALLKIPIERFRPVDLAAPVKIGRQFDLALSLEVAEHLPEATAEAFVAFLTELAPIIVFSAAIPFQPGTHHVNCQWPDYWQSIFGRHGYAVIDPFRDELMLDQRVERWYAQNLLVGIRFQILESRAELRRYLHEPVRRLVHPELYYFVVVQLNGTVTRLEASLEQVLAERDGQITTLNQAVAERDGQIATLNRAVAERDEQIASLNQMVAEGERQIASLNEAIAERDEQIASLAQTVTERNATLASVYASTSWHLTAPLRFLSRSVRWRG